MDIPDLWDGLGEMGSSAKDGSGKWGVEIVITPVLSNQPMTAFSV
jgi:hypothetical protein